MKAQRDEMNKVEAILFTTGKFMNLDEIARVCGIASVGYVKQLIEELKKDYEQRGCSLIIYENDGQYKLNVKKEYGELTNKLVGGTEFDNPTTKTLAVIAYKQPVMQSEIIKIRGNKAYDHTKRLIESELITSEKSGRTRILKLTSKFYDYFDTAEGKVKEEFNKIKDAMENKQDIGGTGDKEGKIGEVKEEHKV